MTTYAIIDSETTGLDSPIKAVEVAWILIDENMNTLEEEVHRVNPFRPINEGAIAIHNITDQMVANCPPIEEVVTLLPQPFVAIGHNVAFDLRVLGPYIEYCGDMCTLALSRRWVKGTTNHKLVTLKAELGFAETEAHSALGDCRSTLELLKFIANISGRNLVQLIELESVPKMLAKMPFGMHRGKNFSDVPKSYREWLLAKGKDDLHKDIRYTLEKMRVL